MMASCELNGDDRLALAERLAYLWRNLMRNLSGPSRP